MGSVGRRFPISHPKEFPLWEFWESCAADPDWVFFSPHLGRWFDTRFKNMSWSEADEEHFWSSPFIWTAKPFPNLGLHRIEHGQHPRLDGFPKTSKQSANPCIFAYTPVSPNVQFFQGTVWPFQRCSILNDSSQATFICFRRIYSKPFLLWMVLCKPLCHYLWGWIFITITNYFGLVFTWVNPMIYHHFPLPHDQKSYCWVMLGLYPMKLPLRAILHESNETIPLIISDYIYNYCI